MVELLFGLLKKSTLIVLFFNETYVVVAQNNRLDETVRLSTKSNVKTNTNFYSHYNFYLFGPSHRRILKSLRIYHD